PTARASSTALATAAVAPRGHSRIDTITPTNAPTTTSSTRIKPTLHPVGTMRLKMINTIIVKAAWPAMNDATSGTNAEPKATTGSSAHMTPRSTPTNSMTTTPNRNPIAVPATARNTRVPVVSALLRNTDIAPSTTQNPCCTGNTCVTATASANPSPVRRLLRSTTALVARNPLVMAATATVSGITQSAAPVSGSRRPSTRAHTGRASAAAAL